MGDPVYEERRRLKAENELLNERKFNARLKREANVDETIDVMQAAIKDFFEGRATLQISANPFGAGGIGAPSWAVRFVPAPPQEGSDK